MKNSYKYTTDAALKQKLFSWARFIKNLLPQLLLQDRKIDETTDVEIKLINELRSVFCKIDLPISGSNSEAENNWTRNRERVRQLVLNQDPREFLRWDCIQATMFSNKFFHYNLLNYLKQTGNWKSVWKKAIEETNTGHPIPFFLYPRSSGAVIQHAYHLCQFKEKTGERLDRINLIFEFGGGYGGMCRLIHKLNFKGKYIICDLPEFSALQTFYLKSEKIPVHSFDSFKSVKDGVICLSDVKQLKYILCSQTNFYNSLFIATWSLSETPLPLRKEILNLASSFNSFLITYQEHFCGTNNIEFFEEIEKKYRDVNWYHKIMKYMPKSRYFIGVKS